MPGTIDFEWTQSHPDLLAEKIERFGDLVADELEDVMDEIVLRVQSDAARLVNVDTGRLRASIEGVVERLAGDLIEGTVGSNVEYAKYQEYIKPYLRPAIESNWPMIRTRVSTAVRRAWEAA